MQRDTVVGAGGVRLPRERRGAGDTTLILIHGWSCHRGFWAGQAERLAGDYRTVSLDLGGHGEAAGERMRWDLDSFAEDTIAAAAGIDGPLVLAGHSMGGAVALLAAASLSDRVRGVVLGDTFAFDWGRIPEAECEGFENAIRSDLAAMVSNLVDNATAPDIDPELRDWLKAEMSRTDPAVAAAAFGSLLRFDADAALAALPSALPIHAINCPKTHPAPRERYADRIGETVLADTGHFHLLESPERFEAALRETIARFGL